MNVSHSMLKFNSNESLLPVGYFGPVLVLQRVKFSFDSGTGTLCNNRTANAECIDLPNYQTSAIKTHCDKLVLVFFLEQMRTHEQVSLVYV